MKRLFGIMIAVCFALTLQVQTIEAVTPIQLPQKPDGTVYRFWNSVIQKHLMTMDYDEANFIYTSNPSWQHEGEVFRAFTMTDNPATELCNLEYSPIGGACAKICSNGELVFRFIGANRAYFYAFIEEAQFLFSTNPFWTYEGPVLCALRPEDNNQNTVNVYRYFNADLTTHVFTISDAERASINANPAWQLEGIAFAVQTPPTPTSDQKYIDTLEAMLLDVEIKISEAEREGTLEQLNLGYEYLEIASRAALTGLTRIYVPEGGEYAHGIAKDMFAMANTYASWNLELLKDSTELDQSLEGDIELLKLVFKGAFAPLKTELDIATIEFLNP